MASRILNGIVIPIAVCLGLLYLRSPSAFPVLKPYEPGWCAWAFAVLVTGIGWGFGLSSLWRGWQRERAHRRR